MKYKITQQEKEALLKIVLDDYSFKRIKEKGEIAVKDAFDINLANIIIATNGDFGV